MRIMIPYYLYGYGILKKVEREKPICINGISSGLCSSIKGKDCDCELYKKYIQSLPSIEVHPDLKLLWKEGQHLQEGKDFEITTERKGGDLYDTAIPIPVEEESQEFLPPDHGDICWTKGAESFTRKEVFMLLYTQRSMIINDLKLYAGNDLTENIYAVLNFPRKPDY
jgi:hypothetical protein